jgi:hypothetical protein
MRIKRRKNTTSFRYKKNEEVVLKDKELDRHRRAFLGKPGSKRWNDFHSGLKETKNRLFPRKESTYSGKTRKNQNGGDPEYTEEENAIFKIISALVEIETGTPMEYSSIDKGADEDGVFIKKKRDCGVTMGWLVDLFDSDDMPELLKFAKKHVDQDSLPLPDAWKNADPDFDVTKLSDIIQDPKKGPCNAEDIKVQYIPFFLQTYMHLIDTLRESVSRKKRNDLFKDENKPDKSKKETETSIDKLTAVAVALSLNSEHIGVDDGDDESVNSDITFDNSTHHAVTSEKTLSKTVGLVSEDTLSETEVPGSKTGVPGSESPESKNLESPEKLRNLILFNITLLRTMNMYSNPTFFDDLYYYYYFLGLDEIFPGMDDFFRFFEMPEQQKNKNDSKVDVEMLIYQQFPTDDMSKEAQDKKHYGYEMREVPSGLDVTTDFDRFLNLVQLHPEPYYKLPIIAKTAKEFRLRNMDSTSDEKDKNARGTEAPGITMLSVANPPPIQQDGGGLFNFIEYYLGIPDSGSYKYLDDNPLIRNFEDVFLHNEKTNIPREEGVQGLSKETPEEFRSQNENYDGDVYLCIYSLDKSCNFDGNGVTPFLKFITTKPGDKWGFPSFHYKSLSDPDQNNASFKCDMFNAVMDCLEIRLCSNTGGGLEIKAEDTNPTSDPVQGPVANPIADEPVQEPDQEPDQEPAQEPVANPNASEPDQEPVQGPVQEPVANPNASEPDKGPVQEPVANPVASEPVQESVQESDQRPVVNPIVESLKEEPPIIVQPEKLKQDCSKIDALLDSVFVGLVSEDIQGKKQVFAFLNYDVLAGLVQSPENPSLDAIFCRNKDTHIYPIRDSNPESKLKWATVDELYFECKIIEDEVDSNISDLFSKHYNLWNIENDGKYTIIPFVVYKVEKKNDVFATVQANSEDTGEMIEEYGSKDDAGIADDYDERYCFTIHPLSCSSSQDASCKDVPRRYAMFAWKTRYVVTESDVALLNGDQPQPQPQEPSDNMMPPQNGDQAQPQEQSDNMMPPQNGDQVQPQEPSDNMMPPQNGDQAQPQPQPPSDNMMPPQNGGDQNETKPALSEEEKDNIASERLLYPTVYTITTNKFTKNVPTVTWGIKNKDQFVGL